ncbi:hypothetical protein ABT147_22085 [Streptomyces sp. NPDC001868]|uniref:hypothetical protein n=1 Tax=Streptomyces sp. NPDC001868 TaxID=3154401 RepID=UPI003317D68F
MEQLLDGPLRSDESMLDADRLAFLKAMNAVDEALPEEPEDDAEEDLDASRDWAADVRDVLANSPTHCAATPGRPTRRSPSTP